MIAKEVVKSGSKPSKNIDNNDANKNLALTVQDIKYARFLAENEKKTRDKALKNLRKWLHHRRKAMVLNDNVFMIIWKGLFYSMWMSDKPLVQEDCAENIASLVHTLEFDESLLYFKSCLKTLGMEWIGIDQLRLDKFYMLVRRMLRHMLLVLKKENWNTTSVKSYNAILEETVLNPNVIASLGLTLHFTEIYLEELSKVSQGDLNKLMLSELLVPFMKQLAFSKEKRQQSCILKHIFRYLLRQSNAGIEYREKLEAWKQMGFPGGNLNALEKEVVDEDLPIVDRKEQIWDIRAGHVDVTLPQLKINCKQVISILNEYKFMRNTNSQSRKYITKVIKEFTDMTKGIYSLRPKNIELPGSSKLDIKKSVNKLVKFEKKLLGKTKKRKLDHSDEVIDKQPLKKLKKVKDKVNKINATAASILTEPLKNFEFSFVRNSGKWFVYSCDDEISICSANSDEDMYRKNDLVPVSPKNREPITKSIAKNDIKSSPKNITIKSSLNNPANMSPPKVDLQGNTTPIKSSLQQLLFVPELNSTPNMSCKYKTVFPQSEWDTPLRDGEVEIFVASKKYKKQMEKLAKSSNQDVGELINSNIKKLKGKMRYSLDSNIVKNPFSHKSKKVKINLRLNKSQEIDEHLAQLKSSPAIPFDSKKKPAKSLLKFSGVSSPINPFYRRS